MFLGYHARMADKDERLIEQGKSALRRSYHESMRSFAKEILENAKEQGYEDYDDARDWIDEQVDQTADGTSWVIYTGQALDVLVASDNWDHVDDEGLQLAENLSGVITQAAYYAVQQDLWEYVDAFQDEYFTEENPKRRKKAKKGALKNKLLR
jgi:hypothetical protein